MSNGEKHLLNTKLAHRESCLVYTCSLRSRTENVRFVGDIVWRCYSLRFLEETD